MKVRIRKSPSDGVWHRWNVEVKTFLSWHQKQSFQSFASEDEDGSKSKHQAIQYAVELANPTIINVNWKEIK